MNNECEKIFEHFDGLPEGEVRHKASLSQESGGYNELYRRCAFRWLDARERQRLERSQSIEVAKQISDARNRKIELIFKIASIFIAAIGITVSIIAYLYK